MSNVIDVQELSKEAGLSFGKDCINILLVPGGAITTMKKGMRYEQRVLDVLDREGIRDDYDRYVFEKFRRRQHSGSLMIDYALGGAMELIKLGTLVSIAYDMAKPFLE